MKRSEADSLVLYHLAKNARKEIHDLWQAAGVVGKDTSEAIGERNTIARAVLKKTEPLLKPRFRFSDLLYEIGVQEGRLKDRRQ
jgi:hypothetical protein